MEIKIETLIEKWIYSPNLDVIPENANDEGLKHTDQDADKHNWSKEDLLAYDYASMRKADESSKTKRAVEKAIGVTVKNRQLVCTTMVLTLRSLRCHLKYQ